MKTSLILPLALLPLALTFTSCGKQEDASKESATEKIENAADKAKNTAETAAKEGADAIASMIEGVHSVECGCSDAVSSPAGCGNFVQVGKKYYEIEGDLGLGKMEWCGQHGVKAQVKGEVKDGKFMADSLTVVP